MAIETVQITVEHDVPVPSSRLNAFSAAVEIALRSMGVGDSFTVPGTPKGHSRASTIAGLAKQVGMEIITRKVGDNLWRVWRTK